MELGLQWEAVGRIISQTVYIQKNLIVIHLQLAGNVIVKPI